MERQIPGTEQSEGDPRASGAEASCGSSAPFRQLSPDLLGASVEGCEVGRKCSFPA